MKSITARGSFDRKSPLDSVMTISLKRMLRQNQNRVTSHALGEIVFGQENAKSTIM